MPLPILTCSWTKCWPNSRPRVPAAAIGAKAAAGRSGAAQGRHGDLVCLFLWRAVASDRTALRHPFGTLYGLFARWTRLGLWRRLLDRLRRDWRRACGDSPELSGVVIDSRSCCSAPSCFDRGVDGGKKTRGVKIHVAVDKYGIPLAIDVSPANRHDTKGIVPVCERSPRVASRARRPATSPGANEPALVRSQRYRASALPQHAYDGATAYTGITSPIEVGHMEGPRDCTPVADHSRRVELAATA